VTDFGIVGDIHGDAAALEQLVQLVKPRVRRLIFLGDYVNRGTRSREVLDLLLSISVDDFECVFLAGNHDRAFLQALDGEFDSFLAIGGAATVRSYVDPPYKDVASAFVQAVPKAHEAFLRCLAEEFVTDDLHVAHRCPPEGQRYRVGGHSPQHLLTPTVTDECAWIDTGCQTLVDGVLTCFLWPSRTWIAVPGTQLRS
jgi:hypothetical protein